MKHQFLRSLVHSALAMASIAFLVSCGGSASNPSPTVVTNNSGTAGTSNSGSSTAPYNLSLQDFDSLPTVAVQSPSPSNSDSKPITSTVAAALTSPSPEQSPVDGFIIKYKNQNGTVTSNNTGSNSARASSGASQILATGLSVGITNVVKQNNISLRFQNEAHDSAKVFNASQTMFLPEAKKIANQMKAADPNIEYVALNSRMYPTLVPNDDYYADYLWALKNSESFGIKAESAWDKSNGNGVVVAVLDTGYRPHADMDNRILSTGYDFLTKTLYSNDGDGRDNNPLDNGDGRVANFCYTGSPATTNTWHGTHVAGTIAANTNNDIVISGIGIGSSGIAYGAKILPVRVLGRCGGPVSDIADAIVWASGGEVKGVPTNKTPAKIINMSLGGRVNDLDYGICNPAYASAIAKAKANGAIVVVSAGNSNLDANLFIPANCSDAITVAATTQTGTKASFSNFGNKVDISAPGVDILSTVNSIFDISTEAVYSLHDNEYGLSSGTSMAAPHVSGVLALMLANNSKLTSAQAEKILKESITNFASGGCTQGCGTGIVNASLAVNASESTVWQVKKDFNADGKTDLLFKSATASSNDYYLHLVNGKKYSSSKIYSTALGQNIVTIGNFNTDKKADLVETDSSGVITHLVLLNGPTNSIAVAPIKVSVTGTQPDNTVVKAAADFNADGLDDLVLHNPATGAVYVALMPTFTTSSTSPNSVGLTYNLVTTLPETQYTFKGSADFDGNGKADLVWFDSISETIKITYLNGSTLVSSTDFYNPSYTLEGVGKFFTQDTANLVVRDSFGQLFVAKIKNENAELVIVGALANTQKISDIGDYNGNGLDDIFWRQVSSTANGIYSFVNNVISKISMAKLLVTLGVVGNT